LKNCGPFCGNLGFVNDPRMYLRENPDGRIGKNPEPGRKTIKRPNCMPIVGDVPRSHERDGAKPARLRR
jgi:hypothetical protein